MSAKLLTSKITVSYARALFDFSVEKNIIHHVTADFQKLEIFLNQNSELIEYLNNPTVNQDAKQEILTKILKSELNRETFKFLIFLINRNRINLLKFIIFNYLELIYETASIKTIEVTAAFAFSNRQKNKLIQILKQLINTREVQLEMKLDPSLIGGFLIKTESKLIDFTIKSQLQQLAKHLDAVLEI
jgi:F-type H+-transporting ATPase subunit delta